jgi:hypothetical protein
MPTTKNQTTLTMSHKEREHLKVIHRVLKHELNCEEAAAALGLSVRQIYRIRDRYASDGDEGLIHRLRGATSNFGYGYTVRKRVIALYREQYSDYGPTLFAEKLEEHHSNLLSLIPNHETIRRWLLTSGDWATERVRRVHRRKRERRDAIGSLLQFDGSDHDWFERRGPRCCLLVAIDDASGRVLMRFAPSENTRDVLLTLRAYVAKYGIPHELYTDRAGVYHTKDGKYLTDVGRALTRLGVKMITAHSPQAKGRVERSNRTHQDRLVKALRQEGISTIEAANRFLERVYLNDHNRRFALTEGLKDSHRPSAGLDLENIFCFETTRRVYNDYTITLGAAFIQLERSKKVSLPPPGQTVTVRHHLDDDSLHIFWNEQELHYSSVKERPKQQTPPTRPPSSNHPWRLLKQIGKGRYRDKRTITKSRSNSRKKTLSSTPRHT